MFANKEVKIFTIKYLISVLLIGFLLFCCVKHFATKVDEAYFKELLVSAQSQEFLEDTGRLSNLPSEYNTEINSAIDTIYMYSFGCFTLLAVVGYFIGLSLYKVPMKAIARIGENSEAVLEGNYNTLDFSHITEGDISQFYGIYTKMVSAIKQGKDKEMQEKVFLQDLIADISHQLKTPLATLTIYQDLLSNPDISEEKKQDMLKLMGEQLTRMEWLILSMLKLARLEAGAIQFVMEKQPLKPTIMMSVQNVNILSSAKNQTININCQDDIILNHDKDWLAEALTNILKNATEYAPVGSNIDVSVEHTPVMTMIHIKDYGKGIPPEAQPKIFKRFYRAKSDVNENSIGIGLSLSKGIVESQNGDITVESKVGKYTCFTVSFYNI